MGIIKEMEIKMKIKYLLSAMCLVMVYKITNGYEKKLAILSLKKVKLYEIKNFT